jgi:hypothetical protein
VAYNNTKHLTGGLAMNTKMLELWERLNWDLQWFFNICIDGKPTPARIRVFAEALLELREIMLMDDLENTWTLEACRILESWIERTLTNNNSFDIVAELRTLKEVEAGIRKAKKENHNEG